jgi:hypothetical protein
VVLVFEWNELKALENRRKHGVAFDEAKSVFGDPFLLTYPDEAHSVAEERFISVGMSSMHRLLVVVHVEREDRIRIVSCRKATKRERQAYKDVV